MKHVFQRTNIILALLLFCTAFIGLGRGLAQNNATPALSFLPGDETAGPAAVAQQAPFIARGGETLLAVWSDRRSSPPNTGDFYETANDIYAMRLDSDGNLLDSLPFVITQTPANQDRPQAAWNGTNWLVVFETARISGTGGYYEQSLAAVRVAADGQVLDSSPIPIFNTVPNIGTWAVASDGVGWVVAFQGSAASMDIQAIRILADGQVQQPAISLVPETYYMRFNLHLAYADGVFLLTWADYSDTLGLRFDANLNALDATPFDVALGTGITSLASNGSQFYVAWVQQQIDFSMAAVGSRISTAGVRLDGEGDNISGNNPPAPDTTTSVAWDGQNWQVSWGYNSAVSVARVNTDGVVLDPGGVSVSGPETGLSAGDGAGGIHLIWNPYVDSQTDIVSAHISAAHVAGPNRTLSIGAPMQFAADFAVGSNGYMAVYRSDTASTHRIHVQPLDANGNPLTTEPIELDSGDIIYGPGQPSVAWNGSLYLVTWNNSSGIVAQRVQQDGTLVDANPFLVITTGIGPTDVAVVGDTFLVVGRKYGSYPQYLYPVAARVRGTDGVVLDATPLYVGESYARSVAVTAVGDRWLTVWFSAYTHDDSVGSTGGNFVTTDGTLGTSFSIHGPYSMGGNGINEVAAASDGITALVLQSVEYTSGVETDLIGRVVNADGTVQSMINLTPWSGNQYRPHVAWDGSQYVVAYTEQRNRFAPHTMDQLDARGDLFGMRIAADGTIIDPQGFAFSILPLAETHPNVVSAGGVSLFSGSILRNEAPFAALRVGYARLGLGDNQWPVAVANSNVTGGNTPLNVQFNSTGSLDPDGTIAAYGWDFGDGSTSSQTNPNHIFNTPGDYVVTLVVTDTEGAATTQALALPVTAPNQLPVVNATANPLSGQPPLDVTFYARGSYDPDGSLGNFHWTFSTGNDYWGATNYETFPSAGIYYATLTVYDNRGGSATDTVTIYVGQPNQPPVAVASATPLNGDSPLDVSFSSAGSQDPDGSIATYAWNFGDGGTSAQANPAHIYTTPGVYQATLTVTDHRGGTDSDTLSITANGVTLPEAQAAESTPGQTITYTLSAQYFNQGNAPTADFDVSVNISGAQWAVDAPTSIAIAPGASSPLIVVVHVPAQANPGEQSIAAVTLTSPDNPTYTATATLTTSIPLAGGIELSPATASASGWPGAPVTYTLTLTNTGSVTQTYTISAESGWEIELAANEVTLEPGVSATILITIHIPTSANAGEIDIATITATSTTEPGTTASTTLTTHAAYRMFLPLLLRSAPSSSGGG